MISISFVSLSFADAGGDPSRRMNKTKKSKSHCQYQYQCLQLSNRCKESHIKNEISLARNYIAKKSFSIELIPYSFRYDQHRIRGSGWIALVKLLASQFIHTPCPPNSLSIGQKGTGEIGHKGRVRGGERRREGEGREVRGGQQRFTKKLFAGRLNGLFIGTSSLRSDVPARVIRAALASIR